ncbi:uncharacterized protein LOC114526731 isoform X1 [Dendronephthya gigantea]|nr:uncharacterized protein LOC114526731 isoform X1 [Dendronephthya gigantea]
MLSFSMENLSNEIKDRAPLFHSVLAAASINKRSKSTKDKPDFAAVAMAASICLKNRSRYMTAVQLLLTIFLYHSNWMNTLARLCPLKITTSHTYVYKKLDEFGKDYNKDILHSVKEQGEFMEQRAAQINPDAHGQQNNRCFTQDVGRKLVFDNIDYHQEVHRMTEDHQNVDKHCVTVMAIENRVSGNHLGEEQPKDGILKLQNGKCLPSCRDNQKQRDNYIALVGRVISTNIKSLEFLSDAAVHHIPHMYTKEMCMKSDLTFLGMLHDNENDSDGILAILKSLQKYVPCYGEDKDKQYAGQGVVGDQLSVERGVNGLSSVANGFTPDERIEGLHFEIADWHAGNKFLEVAFSQLYNVASAGDKCTMFSDRNLVNRRNVKQDVTAAANACRRFFVIEVEARIIAAAMHLLGMQKIDEEPSKHKFSTTASASLQERKSYLNNISSLVIDEFVIDQRRNSDVEESVNSIQEDLQTDIHGRFPCRAPGCTKTFAHAGKLRTDHEAKHNPPVSLRDSNAHILEATSVHEDDDMLSYQRSLLDYGMLVLNFFDAISEGDGQRVVRCWKFFLMYLKHQGGSAKYSLEALYLMFQINALLSPKCTHHLIWNRFTKSKPGISGNIPLDLQLEFLNKLVKEAIKNQGAGASDKSLDRICHSLGVTSSLMKTFDTNLSVFKRAGRHVKTSTQGDLKKIVNELVVNNAFTCTPGRRYSVFKHVKPSLLSGFDMHKMFTWINNHKKFMILNRKAR